MVDSRDSAISLPFRHWQFFCDLSFVQVRLSFQFFWLHYKRRFSYDLLNYNSETMGERKFPNFGGRRLSRAQRRHLLGLSHAFAPPHSSLKKIYQYSLTKDLILSSNALIAIAFGVFGAIISLISLIIGYLTLRTTTVANGKIHFSCFCSMRSIS